MAAPAPLPPHGEDVCTLGPLTLWRTRGEGGTQSHRDAAAPAAPRHLVSCSVFRIRHGYRDTCKYAAGLLRLVHAVGTHLPDFDVRVYMDESLTDDAFELDARAAEAEGDLAGVGKLRQESRVWASVFDQLKAFAHVHVVWFEWRTFLTPDGLHHADMLGTLMRFIPLFGASPPADNTTGAGVTAASALPSGVCAAAPAATLPPVLPAWAGAPDDGCIVLVTDADYADLTTEHTVLHLVRWYAKSVYMHANSAAASLPPWTVLPHLVAMSTAGSSAERHVPDASMPPFLAGCVATLTRFPLEWLTDFIDDVASPASRLVSRYVAALHDASNQNATYERRGIARQGSRFPFGIDEFFLTNVLKLRCLARATQSEWLFLVLPNIDMVLLKCLSLLAGALRSNGDVLTPALRRIAIAAARAADDASEVRALEEGMDGAAAVLRLGGWLATWGKLAARRVAMYSPFPGCFLNLVPSIAQPLMSALLDMLRYTIDAIAAGGVPHDASDLQVLLQNSQHLSALVSLPGTAPAAIVPIFTVGNGAALPTPRLDWTASLVDELCATRPGCAVPPARLDHVGYYPQSESLRGTRAGDEAAALALAMSTASAYFTQRDAAHAAALLAATTSAPVASALAANASSGAPGSTSMLMTATARAEVVGATSLRTVSAQTSTGVTATDGAVPPAAAPASTALPPHKRRQNAGLGEWQQNVSRKTGGVYYFHPATRESAWHDYTLPQGWAWLAPAGPASKVYVHLASNQRQSARPADDAPSDGDSYSSGDEAASMPHNDAKRACLDASV